MQFINSTLNLALDNIAAYPLNIWQKCINKITILLKYTMARVNEPKKKKNNVRKALQTFPINRIPYDENTAIRYR